MDIDLLIHQLQQYQNQGSRRVFIGRTDGFEYRSRPVQSVALDRDGDILLTVGIKKS